MPDAGNDQASRDTKELLLKEYDSLSESIWRNEATGETRVNWFVGIVTVGIGALVKLVASEHRPHGRVLGAIVIGCLCGLAAFGFVTFRRIIERNKRTDRMIHDLDTIRSIFQTDFGQREILQRFHPFGRSIGENKKRRKIPRRFGGLGDLVGTINAVLAGGLAFAIVFFAINHGLATHTRELVGASIIAFVVSVAAFSWQYWFSRFSEPTHAGGVVYRDQNNTVTYLLIRPRRRDIDEWVLPKGHIEPDENAQETAAREVKEEAGINARIVRPLGVICFRVAGERVRAKFFLMKQTDETKTDSEGRDCQWLPFRDAIDRATHPQTKRLLKRANARVSSS